MAKAILIEEATNQVRGIILVPEDRDYVPPQGFVTQPYRPGVSPGDVWDPDTQAFLPAETHRRDEAQARVDEYNDLETYLMSRLDLLDRNLRDALVPVYDDILERKHRELRVSEAQARLREER